MAIIRKQKKWSDGIGYFYVAYDPEKKSQRVEITSDINATFEQRDQEVIFQTTVNKILYIWFKKAKIAK